MVKRKPNQHRSSSWSGGRYIAPRRKFCFFCADRVEVIDYKEAEKLNRYILEGGKIAPRRKTGTCARHQRAVATAIKRARHLALLPYVPAHIRKVGNVARGE